MKHTRRKILVMAFGVLGTGVGYYLVRQRGVASYALDLIREVYGSDVADQEAASEFANAYQAFVLQKGTKGRILDVAYGFDLQHLPAVDDVLHSIDESIIDKFAMSTNVILAIEKGEPLVFVELFSPYRSTCMNQLGAQAVL